MGRAKEAAPPSLFDSYRPLHALFSSLPSPLVAQKYQNGEVLSTHLQRSKKAIVRVSLFILIDMVLLISFSYF